MYDQKSIGEIVSTLLMYSNLLRIYHWQTKSFSRHQAIDTLYELTQKNIDMFVETIQGSWNKTLLLENKTTIPLLNVDDSSIKDILLIIRNWLQYDLTKMLRKEDLDLLNIRDEMLQNLNQTFYLFNLE